MDVGMTGSMDDGLKGKNTVYYLTESKAGRKRVWSGGEQGGAGCQAPKQQKNI